MKPIDEFVLARLRKQDGPDGRRRTVYKYAWMKFDGQLRASPLRRYLMQQTGWDACPCERWMRRCLQDLVRIRSLFEREDCTKATEVTIN